MKQISRIAILTLLCTAALAQDAKPAPAPKPLLEDIAAHPNWPAAKPADINSVAAIISAVYNVISARGAKDTPHTDGVLLTIDDYIARSSGNMTASGVLERGIHNEVQQFGNIVHVWSTYESRHDAADPTPFARGINSFQLLKDGDRYWVVNIFWDSERPTNPIPEKYLTK